jgi:rod shape-determining protein MreD
MGPAFAAIGAGIAALLDATIASRFDLFGAQLHLVLVTSIAVTLVYGFEEGMVWAFVGGLLVDFLMMRPLGAGPFALLIPVALTEVASPLLSRVRYPGILAAVAVLTPIYVSVSAVLTGLLNPGASSVGFITLIGSAGANVILAALVSPIMILVKRRAEYRERVVWWR